MQKRSSKKKKKKRSDINELASNIVNRATTEDEEINIEIADQDKTGKNPAAVALGRLGGLKGGKARAKKLTPEERQEIARKAALARWRKSDDDSEKKQD